MNVRESMKKLREVNPRTERRSSVPCLGVFCSLETGAMPRFHWDTGPCSLRKVCLVWSEKQGEDEVSSRGQPKWSRPPGAMRLFSGVSRIELESCQGHQ